MSKPIPFIDFDNVSFTYPLIQDDFDENGKQIIPSPVFDNFTAQLPGDFVSLIGPNGSGKSTFLLLAAGRVLPQAGSIKLLGTPTSSFFTQQGLPLIEKENEKNLLASFIYQNMEFESDEKVALLLDSVFENGGHKDKSDDFKKEVIKAFQLDKVLDSKLNAISKGEIQRVLLGFSVLYGSKSIFMDEPLFALENIQKESALSFLRSYGKTNRIPIFISMHELELSRKYARKVLLFYPDRRIDFGTPEEVLTEEALEDAYKVPVSMLKDSEVLDRKTLQERSDFFKANA